MEENNQVNYVINQKILAMMNGLDPESKIAEQEFNDYLESVSQMNILVIAKYLKDNGYSSQEINDYLNVSFEYLQAEMEVLKNVTDPFDYTPSSNFLESDKQKEMSKLLTSQEFQDHQEQELNKFNQTYYISASENMSQEDKDKLNAYLDELDDQREQNLQQLLKLRAEILAEEEGQVESGGGDVSLSESGGVERQGDSNVREVVNPGTAHFETVGEQESVMRDSNIDDSSSLQNDRQINNNSENIAVQQEAPVQVAGIQTSENQAKVAVDETTTPQVGSATLPQRPEEELSNQEGTSLNENILQESQPDEARLDTSDGKNETGELGNQLQPGSINQPPVGDPQVEQSESQANPQPHPQPQVANDGKKWQQLGNPQVPIDQYPPE